MGDIKKAYGMTDYCPNCGADMMKGDAENGI